MKKLACEFVYEKKKRSDLFMLEGSCFVSAGQKGLEEKEKKRIKVYPIIMRKAFSQLVKGNQFIPT